MAPEPKREATPAPVESPFHPSLLLGVRLLAHEQMRLGDDFSRRLTTALADAAEVLTPSQRADLARRLEQRFGPRRG